MDSKFIYQVLGVLMESKYLYRVLYKGNMIFEGDEDNAKLMYNLMENKEELKLQRAQLVWWDVPPETDKVMSGTT